MEVCPCVLTGSSCAPKLGVVERDAECELPKKQRSFWMLEFSKGKEY